MEEEQIPNDVKFIADTWLQKITGGNKSAGGGGNSPPPRSPPPIGGTMDPMEGRFEKLEDRVGKMDDRLTRVESKLDYVAHEVGQTKWWMLGVIITMIVTVLGTGIAIQQMTVSSFQAAATMRAPEQSHLQPIIINVPAPATPSSR